MTLFPDHMRPMAAGEDPSVDALLRAAFEGEDEVKMVHHLRKTDAMAGETVLPMGDRIVGYYALSQMVAPKGWLCVAPVAVASDVQGRRFCTRMMGMLTQWATHTDTTLVILGKVSLYERAGFSAQRAAHLKSPYPIANTMLAGGGPHVPAETLIYPF